MQLHGLTNCFANRFIVFMRDSAVARICYRPFVRLSVRHTGGSAKNG